MNERICLIHWRRGFNKFEALTDHGRTILFRPTYRECVSAVESLGYAVIPQGTMWHRELLTGIQMRKGVVLQ